ncbi:VCBS repeat-containing protein, partial [Mesorhizobium shonense]
MVLGANLERLVFSRRVESARPIRGTTMLGNGILSVQGAGSTYTTGQTGQISEGQTLTVTGITDPDGAPKKVSYQWYVSYDDGATWQAISGATGTSYAIPYSSSTSSTTVLYKVIASYPEGSGKNAVTDSTTSAIFSVHDVNQTGSVAISGTAATGQTLTATVTDADGVPATGIVYSWQVLRNGTWLTVQSSSSNQYTLSYADGGKQVRVLASYTDTQGHVETGITSASTAPVTIVNQPGSVAINGVQAEGQVLTAVISDPDGAPTSGATYQWQVLSGGKWQNVAGAMSQTYALPYDASGKQFRVLVNYVDGHGNSESLASVGTNAITDVDRVGAVTMTSSTGQFLAGAVLTAQLSDADGLPKANKITYQWQVSVDGVSWTTVQSSTSSQYTINSIDTGKEVRVVASYTDLQGHSEIVMADPVIVAPPAINHPPVVQNVLLSATEDGLAVTSAFAGDDPDADDDPSTLHYTITSQPTEGSVVNNNDGTFSFNPGSGFQDLAAGATRQVAFTYTATDSHGAVSNTGTVSVTVTGVNDNPVITSAAQSGSVSEGDDGASRTATGQVTYSDVDVGDTHAFAVSAAASYGTATVDPNGTWHYTVGDAGAVDALAQGESLSDSFTVRVSDNHNGYAEQTVAVTIHGTNDAPVITSAAQSGNASEGDGQPASAQQASGQVTFNDVDTSDSHMLSVSVAAAHGTASIDPDGTWHYTVSDSGAVDALAAGEHLADSFTVQVDDHNGGIATQTVSIDITGTNDVAVISGTSTGSVVEAGGVANADAGTPMASGTLTDTDVDNPANTFTAVAAGAATDHGYGTFGMTAAGVWTYTLDNANAAVQALNAGDTLTDSFAVTSIDGTLQQISVTIHGTNDVPVIGGVSSGAVTEDVAVDASSHLNASGALTIADVDQGQSSFAAQAGVAGSNGFGTFTLAADGSWTYSADNTHTAIQQLGAGQSLTDSFTAVSSDGTASQLVTVTIHGTNDVPVITPTSQSTSRIDFEDLDPMGGYLRTPSYSHKGFAFAASEPTPTNYLIFYAWASGTALSPSSPGEAIHIYRPDGKTFGISSIDLDAQYAAPYSATFIGTLADGRQITQTFVTDSAHVDFQTFHFDPSFSAGLVDLQFAPMDYPYYVADNIVLTTGSGSDLVGSIVERPSTVGSSSQDQTSGTIIFTDADLSDTHTVAAGAASFIWSGGDLTAGQQSTLAAAGSIAFNESDSTGTGIGAIDWAYHITDSAIDFLASGQTLTVSYDVTVTDNNGATSTQPVTITISGANDTPVAVADQVVVTEDTPLSLSAAQLVANDTDPDTSDTLSVTSVGNAVNGTAVLNGSAIDFTPAGNFSGMASFDYTIDDGHGGTATATARIDVAPVADTPTLVIGASPTDLTPQPAGGEFRVNSYTANDQSLPSVAALADGGFVVTWMSDSQEAGPYGVFYGVYGQRYGADGAPIGDEFHINTYISDWQAYPSVAALAGGGFVVTWSSFLQDGSGWGVYGQRYGADGAPLGSEFRVNTYTLYEQWAPSVASLTNGGFVVTWQSNLQDGSGLGIYGQRYGADGSPLGSEFRVNTYTANDQWAPSVATLAGGGFVVTWRSVGQDGSGEGVYGQRYGADGAPLGGEFRVNTYTAGDQVAPTVAALASGGFVVTWMSNGQDGSGWGVFGQRYDADGSSGGEFRVNTYTAGDQQSPSVAALADGGFVVTWISYGQDGSSWGLYGQRYDASGTAVGQEFQLNETTAGNQVSFGGHSIPLAVLSDGRLVQTWYGDPSVSAAEVYARLLTVPAEAPQDQPLTLPTITAALTDTDGSEKLVLRLSGFPAGATFSVGALDPATGDWVVSDPADIASLATTPLVMTPPSGWSGSFTLSVTAVVTDIALPSTGLASDTTSITQTLAVTIAPTPVNHAPIVKNVLLSATEDGLAVSGAFAGDDPDADDNPLTLHYTITSQPTEGSVVNNNDGTFSFNPGSGFQDLAQGATRQVAFTYTATDSHGAVSNTGTVTVTVTGVNDGPLITSAAQSGSVSEGDDGSARTATGLVTFSDVDVGDTHAFLVSAAASYGTATVDADGTWHYTVNDTGAVDALAQGESLSDSFTVRVSDTHNGYAEQTVAVTIHGTNDSPADLTLSNDSVPANLAGAIVGTLSAIDRDQSDTLTYSILPGLDGSQFTISGNQLRVGSTGFDYQQASSHSVTVRATDQSGAYVDQTFTVEVLPRNQIALTTGNDTVGPQTQDTQVTGNAVTFNAGDSLTGGSETDSLVLYGSGTFDLNSLAQFTGFEEVDLVNYSNSASALYLRPGQDIT